MNPLELAAKAGYLDAARGASLDDRPPFRFPELATAWEEGWRRWQSDTDAGRSLAGKTSARDAEVAGSSPVALPDPTPR